MTEKRVGALVIGGSPRPDLVAPLAHLLPEDCQLLQAGALDGLTRDALPAAADGTRDGNYPLTTRLQDGSLVTVEEAFITPRLQGAMDRLEAQGVVATLLLCAGTFAQLRSARPLVKPFDAGRALLQLLGFRSLGLIAPFEAQENPIRGRWQAAGFRALVWTADINRQDDAFYSELKQKIEAEALECIVLDYVGHKRKPVRQLQEACPVPVIDLGQLAMRLLVSVL